MGDGNTIMSTRLSLEVALNPLWRAFFKLFKKFIDNYSIKIRTYYLKVIKYEGRRARFYKSYECCAFSVEGPFLVLFKHVMLTTNRGFV